MVFLNDIVVMKKPLGEAIVAWLVVTADELTRSGRYDSLDPAL